MAISPPAPCARLTLQVYEEAGSDFHQVAYFRTRIGLRNALQEEISGSSDKEAVLITLNRPIVFAQPVAFDRGSVHIFDDVKF